MSPLSYGRLLSVGLMLMSCSLYANGPDCNEVLKYAKITDTTSQNSLSVRNFYSAFCSTKITSIQQAKSQAQKFGVEYDGFGLDFGDNSSDAEITKFFEKTCSEIDSHQYSKNDFWHQIEQIDSGVVHAYESCLKVPGIWATFSVAAELREQVEIDLINVAGARGRDAKITQSIKPKPSEAISKRDACVETLTNKTTLRQNTPLQATCVLNKDWTGRTISFSGKIDDSPVAWTLILPPKPTPNLVPPPPAPAASVPEAPKPATPELVLVRNSGAVWAERLGEWLRIEQPANTTTAPMVSIEGFSLYINDPSEIFAQNGNILAGVRLQKTGHQEGHVTGPVRNAELHVIPIQFHTKNIEPLRFSDYEFQMRGLQPNYTDIATLTLDATKAKYFGIQARLAGGGVCDTQPVVTSVASGASAEIQISQTISWAPVNVCILEMRLCAAPDNPIFSNENSCQTNGKPPRASITSIRASQ